MGLIVLPEISSLKLPQPGLAVSTSLFDDGGFLVQPYYGRNLVNGKIGTRTATVTPTKGPYGNASAFSGTTSSVDFGACALDFSLGATFIAVARPAAWSPRWIISARDGGNRVGGITWGDGSAAGLQISAGGAAATGGIKWTGASLNVWYVIVGTVAANGAYLESPRLWINGVEPTLAAVGNFIPPTGSSIMLGTRLGATTYLNGSVALAGIIPRILTDTQIKQISSNLRLLFAT